MKDKRTISIRKLTALERGKALGLEVNRPGISSFERKAREWKRCEEIERAEGQSRTSGVQRPKSKVQDLEPKVAGEKQNAGSFIQGSVLHKKSGSSISSVQYPVSSMNGGFDWQPYWPEQGEAGNKVKGLNSASIGRLARKIMVKEWAGVLGGKSFEGGVANIELKATAYKKKLAAKRERRELKRKRAIKQRDVMEVCLHAFGRNLLKAPKPVTPELLETLLQKALSQAGDIIHITWQPNGCEILLEPWEEKRLRRENKETMPVVFEAAINDNLMITSFQIIEDPRLLSQIQNDIILKNILSNFRKLTEKNFQAFENTVAERGRIIRSTKWDSGWKINFEPWEEMRKRNLERKGKPPIMAYMVMADKEFDHFSCERV